MNRTPVSIFFATLSSLFTYGTPTPFDRASDFKWTKLETDDALILTDGAASTTQEAAARFHTLESLVLAELGDQTSDSTDNRSLRPHYLLLPKSGSLFRDLSPIRTENRNGEASGFYIQSDFNPLILAQAKRSLGDWESVHHEYVHRILHAHFDALPTWADEGLAELFSSFRQSKRHVQLQRSGDRTKRYNLSKRAFHDWQDFFATNSEDLREWIRQGELEAQAYYAQAALLAELAHLGDPERKRGYWALVERSRYKPITELDARLLLRLDFAELDRAIRRQLNSQPAKRFPIHQGSLPNLPEPQKADVATVAAALAIAYSRSGKAELAQQLLNRFQDLENPTWLAAKSETHRSLGATQDSHVFAIQAMDTKANDPFLTTLSTLRLYNSGDYEASAALDALARAHSRGDTSPLLFELHFSLARKADLPFDAFAPLAKEGLVLHSDLSYAPELTRLEANQILSN